MQNPLARFVPSLAGEYPRTFTRLFEKVSIPNGRNGDEIKEILWKAYEFGDRVHQGQKRKSGKPYFEHCIAVAETLASWNMDPVTIMGGLLHDSIEDTEATYNDLVENFGDDVAQLVDGVTKLGGLQFSSREERQAGNFMKMLLSVAKDLRVIIIKFADRLHNMRTIEYMPRIKQHRIAIETRDVYSPLAHRLGMANVKWQLDDLVFKTINPKAYNEVDKKLKSTTRERERYIAKITKILNEELKQYDIEAVVYGRAKSHESIHRKMTAQEKEFETIYDKEAIRIVVDKVEDCYLALGIMHQRFKPVQERFKDFIATPKSNAYQSIHTTVVGPEGKLVEIQIRTHEMEQTAEIGVAAHWKYKEGGESSKGVDTHVQWLRELLEILSSEESDPREFMHLLKIDLFSDEIFVFTPKGDLVQLPLDSTPIDFAFQVHTEVGMHCLGSKVNQKVAPLNTVLNNGDTVEIITGKKQKPNYGWLQFVVTSKARNRINRYLKKVRTEESISLGTEILAKVLRRLKKLKLQSEIEDSFRKFGCNSKEKLLESIGNGSLTVRHILKKLDPEIDEPVDTDEEDESTRFRFTKKSAKGVKLQGIKDLMVSFGKCCNPIPGDDTMGFITRGRGITVHRSTCSSLPLIDEQSDRLVPIEWDVSRNDVFNVRLTVQGQDRKGILKDLTESISSQNINISSVDMKGKDGLASAYFIVQVNNLRQLDRIIRKMKKVSGVDNVERAER